jgi:MinD superfamily P-loop ATPase
VAFSDVDRSLFNNPETGASERMAPEAAIDIMADLERRGLVHTVWTFLTPFIAGVCNCDRSDCMAMISTVGHDLKMMFKAEWVASVDWDLCKGCRACMRQCQFGVIGFSAVADKCVIDQARCWGCGVCRAACTSNAISLVPRAEVAGLGW